MSRPFYITTTLPYVNADPHIGFATEIIRADIIARWHKLLGEEVFFNTGTDEHGQKIYQKACEEGKEPQAYVDEWAVKFRDLIRPLGISEEINFVRTTDPRHIKAAQEFWRRCQQNGFIYKKNYQVKYCVGCELEKTESELVDGKCPLHPTYELEIREEENYFFKFSAFQDKLLKFYEEQPDFVLPAERFNEIKAFIKNGPQDFSISRLASKMPWGIPVPDEEADLPAGRQVMYVWFDALVNYISVIGWPDDEAKFKKWWVESGGAVQYCGKDNLRQQTAMWQAMLMAVSLPNSQKVIIDGFITSGGQKMSKSIGNVINPLEVVEKYSTDVLRYFVARELSTFEDGDFTWERFKETYNANLANGLGNLTSRIMKMAQDNLSSSPALVENFIVPDELNKHLENFEIGKASDFIWSKIKELDGRIQSEQPFKLVKADKEKALGIINELVIELYKIAKMLEPFLPTTAKKIEELIKANKTPEAPLFLRQD